MFDNGVVDPSEQLHQFIASSLPLPLPNIPLSSSSSFPNLRPFDHHHHHHHHHHSYNIINPQELAQLPPSQLLHPPLVLLRRDRNDQGIKESTISSSIEIERAELDVDQWSNDELLALLRVRSTMENWFPEFTWEHVSRKLAEAGFKRSAEKCKEKFEEESRYFNNVNNLNKNFRFFNELEQLYQPPQVQTTPQNQLEKNNVILKEVVVDEELVEKPSEEEEKDDPSPSNDQTMSDNNNREVEVIVIENSKKRKRQRRFEMMKGFCEEIVNKLMCKQEEVHVKLLEDMVRRDEEKLAKEEAWKKEEMERMNMELEAMAKEQAFASDRQATIIEFLKKFTSSISNSGNTKTTINNPSNKGQKETHQEPIVPCASKPPKPTTTTTTTTITTFPPQSPNSSENPKLAPISPEKPSADHIDPQNASSMVKKGVQDVGKRWPRDEVLALINLRCSLFNNADQNNDKENNNKDVIKAPLWERISMGMSEMGYNRNAKRCKEKWENINKYFRKTKDVNKKRSLDSRTCPYFHQLSSLYNQGILVPPLPSDVIVAALPPPPAENKGASSLDEGEKNNAAALDFEF